MTAEMGNPTLKEARANRWLTGRKGRVKHGGRMILSQDWWQKGWGHSLCKGPSPFSSQQDDWFCTFLQFIYSLAIGFRLGNFLLTYISMTNNLCSIVLENYTSSKKLQGFTHSGSLTTFKGIYFLEILTSSILNMWPNILGLLNLLK